MPAGRRDAEEREDDDETPPTRSYVEALLHGNLSPEQLASLRAEIASRAAEETAELARSYPPPPPVPRSSGMPYPPSTPVPSSRSAGGSRPPVSWAAPREYAPPYGDEDDQPTTARSYRPAPRPPSLPPVELYEDGGEGLTSVHIYSNEEMADVGGPAAHGDQEPFERTYLAALGGAESVLRLAVAIDRVTSLPLEPQAAFVLSRIDGGSSVEDVIDMSGLGRLDTLRMLYELLEQGIIRVEG